MNGGKRLIGKIQLALLAARIAGRGVDALARPSTFLVVCIATPTLTVVYIAMMSEASSLAASGVGLRTALLMSATGGASIVIETAMTDRRGGAGDLLMARGGVSNWAVWGGRGALAWVLGLVIGFITLLLVTLVSGDYASFLGNLVLLPECAVSGVCAGLFLVAASLPLRDPNSLLSLYVTLSPLLAGVLLPVDSYPTWLKPVASFWPGSAAIGASWPGNRIEQGAIREIVVATGWLMLAIVLLVTLERVARRRGTLSIFA